ncbi:MAG: M28 family metallopeptidase, partial [Gemmatimonadales bacterium]
MKRIAPKWLPLAVVAVSIGAGACASEPDAELSEAMATISVDDLVQHTKALASDEFEGRLPSTPGEEKTIEYLTTEFGKLGLQPGNGSSWVQDVPLVSIAADPTMSLSIRRRGTVKQYAYGSEFVAWTTRVVDSVDLEDSELVFVGFGIVAPEYGWDDYADINVEGKTVVILVNDPGFYAQNPEVFTGRAMTYYGRWTYKYEEAARRGAAGAIIVHETAPAAYPWQTVEGSWTGPQFGMVSEDDNMSRVKVEGWVQLEVAREIFQLGGLDYDELKQRAMAPDFEAVPMGVNASVAISNTLERSASRNFLALLPGTDRADETLIYTAHWDHLGRDPSLEGDQIFNGALDNASGTASLLSLAKAFKALETPPRRSILFMAVTAEEQGLLGSAYYGENPIYPLEKTVAAINIDGLNVYGPMKDIVVIGHGNSELDDYLIAAAESQGRAVRPDPQAEKGYFYRSDHFSLAKQGVPALYTDTGDDHVEYGIEWTQQKKDEWTATHYHRPSDEYSDDWDLRGAVDDIKLWFVVGYRLANESTFPNWREGS